MKQKRKVKSLLPHKRNKSLLTTLLIVLSLALCLGSASIRTMSSVGAASINQITNFNYPGLDDNRDVIYRIQFVKPEKLDTISNEIYMSGNALYISPNPVIVNPLNSETNDISTSTNEVKNGVYGHILGGYKNKVNSNNVTLIAGKSNTIPEGNDNITVLGGISNTIRSGNTETPIVIVGGTNNSMGEKHNGNILIGGSGNTIGDNISNSAILGGEGNNINAHNVIVGGKNVRVRSGISNIFAFSDKNFEPETTNTFYLNLSNGVRFNTPHPITGLSIGGAISFGEIGGKECKNKQNFGVIGSLSGCLVGCTKAGSGKWELLDRGEYCKEICNKKNDSCTYGDDVYSSVEREEYTGYCTTGVVDTTNAHLCTNDKSNYNNAIFESVLIDSEDKCPTTDENKCIYQCNAGWHLTGNRAGGNSSNINCYESCDWRDENGNYIEIKHNQTVFGYNINKVSCSNDDYKFPSETTPNNPFHHNNNGAYESCTNYDHMKKLVCNNGTLYLANSQNQATNISAESYGYIHPSCNLHNYKCNILTYNLNKTFILSTGREEGGNINWNTQDRKNSDGTRGIYKLCLDWNPKDGGNSECTENDQSNPHEEHYQLIKCKDHYSTGTNHPYTCLGKCTDSSGKEHEDGDEMTFYKKKSETCTGVCIAADFKCNDGTWEPINSQEKKEDYLYDNCELKDFSCNTNYYNVDMITVNQRSGVTSIYEFCDNYTHEGQFKCNTGDKVAHLTGCMEGYHTENGKRCISNITARDCKRPNTSNWHWLRPSGSLNSYPRSHIFTVYKTNLDQGKYLRRWNENCTRNGNILSCWTNELEDDGKVTPGEACKWECDEHYKKDSTNEGCEPINYACGSYKYTCEDPVVEAKEWSNSPKVNDGIHTYRWDCGITTGCHACDQNENSVWSETDQMCIEIKDAQCDNSTYDGCNPGIPTNGNDIHDNGFKAGRTWDCQGIGGGSYAEGCHKCEEGYERSGGTCIDPNKESLQCGSASGGYYTDTQNIYNNACIGGIMEGANEYNNFRNIQQKGDEYVWNCTTGGITIECRANIVACGDANEKTFENKPTDNLCNNNSLLSNSFGYYDRPIELPDGWYWYCAGGGVETYCSASKPNSPECTGEEPSGPGVIKSTEPPTDNKSWAYTTSSTLQACQWTCAPNYEKDGTGCKIDNHFKCSQRYAYKCESGANTIDGINTGVSTDLSTLTWRCGENDYCKMCNIGYYDNGEGCKKETYSCSGTFENATPIANSYQNLTENTDSQLFATGSDVNGAKCARLCNSGYYYVIDEEGKNPQCVKCMENTYDERTHSCIIKKECDENHRWGKKDGKWDCLLIADCTTARGTPEHYDNYPMYTNWSGNGFAGLNWHDIYNKIRPLGENTAWTCYDGDSSHEITENSVCEMKCKSGYVCGGNDRCGKVECSSTRLPEELEYIYPGSEYVYTGRNGATEVYEHYKPIDGTPDDWENFKNSTTTGCWYYCPHKTQTIENGNTTITISCLQCAKSDLYGGVTRYNDNPREFNEEYKIVSLRELNDYKTHNISGCYEACSTGYNYTEIDDIAYKKVCLKKCTGENEYFNALGGCYECNTKDRGEIPGEYDEKFSNFTKCINGCNIGEKWHRESQSCQKEVQALTCDEGYHEGNREGGTLICHKCLLGASWDGTGCVRS